MTTSPTGCSEFNETVLSTQNVWYMADAQWITAFSSRTDIKRTSRKNFLHIQVLYKHKDGLEVDGVGAPG